MNRFLHTIITPILWLFYIFLSNLICLNSHLNALPNSQTDILIFSYDRPMQIYALLESLDIHTKHINQTTVLYRCTNQEMRHAYNQVMEAFPLTRWREQLKPPYDFQPLLLEEVFQNENSKYIAFAVDDLIVTDKIDFNQCTQAMEITNAYAFYLRLGHNIEPSTCNAKGIPLLSKIDEHIYAWQFKSGRGTWAYPNTVDLTIYRKQDLQQSLKETKYFNANTLEDNFGKLDLSLTGLCYDTSRVVNIPLNIVSETTGTIHLNISPKDLLDNFNKGLKIDISPLFQFNNNSPHIYHYYPTFIYRSNHIPK